MPKWWKNCCNEDTSWSVPLLLMECRWPFCPVYFIGTGPHPPTVCTHARAMVSVWRCCVEWLNVALFGVIVVTIEITAHSTSIPAALTPPPLCDVMRCL